jgi:diguanylate cyclase (GGDEF)-like protein
MSNKTTDLVRELELEITQVRAENEMLKKKLTISNSSFFNIIGKSLDAVIIINQQKMILYANFAAIELFDKNISDLLEKPLNLGCDLTVLFEGGQSNIEVIIQKPTGKEAITEASILRTEWNHEEAYLICFRDITERKNSEEFHKYMSNHDYLTKLPNRIFFEKRMTNAISTAQNYHQHMALLYLDLDNFKIINDTYGHDIGDMLLQSTAEILKSSVRENDTVARLGGDEFAIIVGSIGKPSYAKNIALKIIKNLNKKYDLGDGKETLVEVSIGIAIYPSAGETITDLLKNADKAMYQAKKKGKNQVFLYDNKEENFN